MKRARAQETLPEPMPYTVDELLSSLASGSGGRIAISPCVRGHAVEITARIRELAAMPNPPTTEDWATVGEYVTARWDAIDLGPGWAAKDGALADALAKARRWVAAGKPGRGVSPHAPSQPRLPTPAEIRAESAAQRRRANGEE